MKKVFTLLFCLTTALLAVSCTEQTSTTNQNAGPSSSPVATPTALAAEEKAAMAQPLTLPVLDAFFADDSFPGLLKARLQLTDDQIAKLKELAHVETAKLNEASAGQLEGETAAARDGAEEKLKALLGEEKAQLLASLVRERWSEAGTTVAAKSAVAVTTNPTTPEEFAARTPNSVPTDSRIIVNAPAYRMDVFDNGRLVKSYKIGIGYPQFPLPIALRKARTIIFNPTWTPPDEPWVAKMRNIKAGEKVEAGSKLNPLGPIKIPIGQPSLIHGGKPLAKLGTFASHGCVGLTSPQVRDFAKVLAEIGGAKLGDADLARYARDKTETKQLKLDNDVPVELRYETIVAEDGKLHIYRDVYDQNTNTEENLREVLKANGVKLEDLTPEEQGQVMDALAQMSGKSGSSVVRTTPVAKQTPSPESSPGTPGAEKAKTSAPKKTPRASKNQKEIVIEIAALKGRGYPAPVNLDTGSGRPTPALASAKPTATPVAKP